MQCYGIRSTMGGYPENRSSQEGGLFGIWTSSLHAQRAVACAAKSTPTVKGLDRPAGVDLQGNVDSLVSHLGPIFCCSPEDQELFRDVVMTWRKPTRPSRFDPLTKWTWPRVTLLAMIATTLCVWIGWKLFWQPVPPFTAEQPTTTGLSAEAPDSAGSLVISAPQIAHENSVATLSATLTAVPLTIVGGVALVAGLMTFGILWIRCRSRRQSALRRMSGREQAQEIGLDPPPPAVSIDIPQPVLRRVAAGLRRVRAQTVLEFNAVATVEATARAGGLFIPAFAPRLASPEYFVLIDRRGQDDHAAHILHRWIEQLCNRSVAARSRGQSH
jgi:hypothetical protein